MVANHMPIFVSADGQRSWKNSMESTGSTYTSLKILIRLAKYKKIPHLAVFVSSITEDLITIEEVDCRGFLECQEAAPNRIELVKQIIVLLE